MYRLIRWIIFLFYDSYQIMTEIVVYSAKISFKRDLLARFILCHHFVTTNSFEIASDPNKIN